MGGWVGLGGRVGGVGEEGEWRRGAGGAGSRRIEALKIEAVRTRMVAGRGEGVPRARWQGRGTRLAAAPSAWPAQERRMRFEFADVSGPMVWRAALLPL